MQKGELTSRSNSHAKVQKYAENFILVTSNTISSKRQSDAVSVH